MRNLDADHRGQTLADVVAGNALLQVFGEIVFRGVKIDGPGERRAEPGEMGSALVRVDVVGKCVDGLGVAVVPLQRHLGIDAVLLAAHVNRFLVDGGLVLVQVSDEGDDAALVMELMALAVALVVERDLNTAVEEGQLPQPLGECVEAENQRLENL